MLGDGVASCRVGATCYLFKLEIVHICRAAASIARDAPQPVDATRHLAISPRRFSIAASRTHLDAQRMHTHAADSQHTDRYVPSYTTRSTTDIIVTARHTVYTTPPDGACRVRGVDRGYANKALLSRGVRRVGAAQDPLLRGAPASAPAQAMYAPAPGLPPDFGGFFTPCARVGWPMLPSGAPGLPRCTTELRDCIAGAGPPDDGGGRAPPDDGVGAPAPA